MVMKLGDLRKLSKSELWKLYDQEAEHVIPSLNHYREEIVRREQSKQTTWLIILTILVFVATVISAVGVFVK
jgi:hypothetical protein